MKTLLRSSFFMLAFLVGGQLMAVNSVNYLDSEVKLELDEIQSLDMNYFQSMDEAQFLNLTPKSIYKETGSKLNFKEKMALKSAQKIVKKRAADIDKTVYILLAFLGLGWIAIGLLDDWSGSKWIIALVLTALFWLPGFIYCLYVMKDYY